MSDLSLKSLNDNKLNVNSVASDSLKVNGLTVQTAVPAGAVFTDTVTTVNGKTGAILKADVLALGLNDITTSATNGNIKVNGTETAVYTHPASHAATMITGLSTVATSGDYKDLINTPKEELLNGQWDAKDLTLVAGTLTTDSLCWLGQNVQYTQSASPALVTIATVAYSKLRYGQFSVGFRLKSTNVSNTTGLTTLKVMTASGTVVNSVVIKGTDFTTASVYQMFYVPFVNNGQSTGNAFTFAVTSEAVASFTLGIDSIIVSPVHAAVFV